MIEEYPDLRAEHSSITYLTMEAPSLVAFCLHSPLIQVQLISILRNKLPH